MAMNFEDMTRCNHCMKVFHTDEVIYNEGEDAELCPYCGKRGCLTNFSKKHKLTAFQKAKQESAAKLTKLLCEGTQENGICSSKTFDDCKICGYCAMLADFLTKRNVVIQEWFPANDPPRSGVPVLVSYIAWGTEDEIYSDEIACVTRDNTWVWWEGSEEDSTEKCAVTITHWTPLPEPVQSPKEASEAEKWWRTPYNLPWRNVTVNWVDWNNKKMGVKIGSMKEQTLDFADLEITSSSDVQAIKMICDRLIAQMYRTELHNNGKVNALLMEYVSDLLANPYEWNTKL